MNTNTIILQGTTPEDLTALILKGIKSHFEDFKKDFKVKNSDELLSRQQACEFLQIDSSTLWHWTNKGKVTAYGIGNRRYYKKEELLERLAPLKK